MRRLRQTGLFMIAIACVLMYALMFSATTAFADEPTPTTATSEETVEPPANDSQSEPVAEIEEEQDDEQLDASDMETDLPAEPQDETIPQAEEPDAVVTLPTDEEGTIPKSEAEIEEPAEPPAPPPDADNKTVTGHMYG